MTPARLSLSAILLALVMLTAPLIVPASAQSTSSSSSSLTVSTDGTGFGYFANFVNSTSEGQWTLSVSSLLGSISYLEVGAFCLNCNGFAYWTAFNPVVGSSFLVFLPNGTYYVEAGALGSPSSTITVTMIAPGSISVTTINGTLAANFSVGPIAPVCSAGSTIGPAPSYFSSISMVVPSSLGTNTTYPLNWMSDGCNAFATAQVSLLPGAYALNLSSCPWLGCRYTPPPLPRSFTIVSGEETDVNVTIATGIA